MATICYCDGGAHGNGTESARVYGSYKIGDAPIRTTEFLSAYTNNEGEYFALIAMLTALRESNIRDALILCDSALVINQVGKKWRVNEERLRRLCETAQGLLGETGAVLEWTRRDEIKNVLGH